MLGLSPSTYAYYESSRIPPADVLVRIAEVGGVDLHWLLTGLSGQEGLEAMHPVIRRAAALLGERPDAAAPLAAFVEILAETRKFPPKEADAPPPLQEATRAVEAAAPPAGLLRQQTEEDELALRSGPARRRWIPVLGRSAAGVAQFWSDQDAAAGVTALGEFISRHAGRGGGEARAAVAAPEGGAPQAAEIIVLPAAPGEVVEFINAPAIKRRYADAFAVRIDGESMAPDIRHGDLAIVSPSAPAVDGRPAVVQLANQIGVTCKLYRREGATVHLVPVNEQFAPQSFAAEQVQWALRVVARVRA